MKRLYEQVKRNVRFHCSTLVKALPKRFHLNSKTTGFYPQTYELEQPPKTPALTFSVAVNAVNLPRVKTRN